jgi:hypothetical protein
MSDPLRGFISLLLHASLPRHVTFRLFHFSRRNDTCPALWEEATLTSIILFCFPTHVISHVTTTHIPSHVTSHVTTTHIQSFDKSFPHNFHYLIVFPYKRHVTFPLPMSLATPLPMSTLSSSLTSVLSPSHVTSLFVYFTSHVSTTHIRSFERVSIHFSFPRHFHGTSLFVYFTAYVTTVHAWFFERTSFHFPFPRRNDACPALWHRSNLTFILFFPFPPHSNITFRLFHFSRRNDTCSVL